MSNDNDTPRSTTCSRCGIRYSTEHTCPEFPEYHGKWEWDAEHYDEIAVRIYQGGGCTVWFRKLHSSGPTGWHKLVPHPDGSPRDHWLCDDQEFFAAYVRAAEATAVPVGESPFADQELYDELRERSSQNKAILELHMNRMRERYGEAAGGDDA
jgi:hypothetical protein